jgi:DNA polymerase III delta prime subunit
MSKLNKLWVERYRPKEVDDVIFKSEDLKQKFQEMVKKKEIENLLFAGIQGTGKTTLCRILIDKMEINRADYMKRSGSGFAGIDLIRKEIEPFAKSMPLGKFKIVQIEEADRLSHDAQQALREVIEETSETCRFIFTCNYSNKIIPSVKSRFQEYFFATPDFEQVLVYAMSILEAEDVEFDDELLEKYVTSAYPDIRKIVQILQQNSFKGKLVRNEDASSDSDYKFELLELIETSNFDKARKIVCSSIQPHEYDDVYQFLYQNISKSKKFSKTENEKAAIILIADRLYRHGFVAHPHINLDACFIELSNY